MKDEYYVPDMLQEKGEHNKEKSNYLWEIGRDILTYLQSISIKAKKEEAKEYVILEQDIEECKQFLESISLIIRFAGRRLKNKVLLDYGDPIQKKIERVKSGSSVYELIKEMPKVALNFCCSDQEKQYTKLYLRPEDGSPDDYVPSEADSIDQSIMSEIGAILSGVSNPKANQIGRRLIKFVGLLDRLEEIKKSGIRSFVKVFQNPSRLPSGLYRKFENHRHSKSSGLSD